MKRLSCECYILARARVTVIWPAFNGYSRIGMLALLMTLMLTIREAASLTLREVSVPAVVMRGDPVLLNCSFDLEGDKLYSVKWHKDNVEFYRYLPDDIPSAQKYHLEGIHVDLYKCKEGYVYMYRTDVDSAGIYRCEVSTDAPSFQTVKGEGEMRIYVYPSKNPAITGNQPHYSIGDNVNVSCVAAPSRPAAFLKWFINDKEAPNEYLRRPEPKETEEGLVISSLGLRFMADRYQFPSEGGTMTLHCEAIISQAHTLTSEEIVVSLNNTDSKSTKIYSKSAYEALWISGGRFKYQVGDLVDINCTASKSQPPAELRWYINDKEMRHENLVPYTSVQYADGQESTVLGLRFQAKQRHFQKGQMRLRCTSAALSEAVRMSSPKIEVSVTNNRQQVSGLHVYEKARAVLDSGGKNQACNLSPWNLLILLLLTKCSP